MNKDSDKGFSGLSSMVSNIDPILTDEEILDTGGQGVGDLEVNEGKNIPPDLNSSEDKVTVNEDRVHTRSEQGVTNPELYTGFHISDRGVRKPRNVSKMISVSVILFVVLIGSIYAYQTYSNSRGPEKIVRDFYRAYFDRDYHTVASNLSVFWSVRFLPDYKDKGPAILLAERSQIEQEIAAVIAEIEAENKLPEDLSIKILEQYTKIGTNSALVVYDFLEKGQPTSREAALLINEKGQFRIFNMTPIDGSLMEEVKNISVEEMDAGLATLLQP